MAKQPDNAQILTLDLDMLIVKDDWNARNIGDKEAYASEVKRLARSIREHGQDTPVLVRKDKDGRYFLLAGFRRYHAIRDVLGGKTIRVAIRESAGTVDDLITNLRENVERKSLTTYDLAARCHLLKKEHKMDSAAIAAALAGGFDGGEGGKTVSTAHIDRLVSYFDRLHPVILGAWKDGEKWASFNAITQAGIASKGITQQEQKEWADKERGGMGKGKKGDKKGKPEEKKVRRTSPAMLEAALKACADAPGGRESYVDGVVEALMFALGRRAKGKTYPLIRYVYDPKAPKAKEGKTGEAPAEPAK